MAGAPALALMHASAPPSSSPAHVATGELAVASVAPAHRIDDVVAPSTPAPDEATTTVPPVTSTTAVSAVPTTVARRATTTTAPRRTSTTLRAAPKATTAPAKPAPRSGSGSSGPSGSGSGSAAAAPAGNSQSGGATWYDAAPPGTCAHKTLPMGTIVTIHATNGRTATCKVSDRGPYASGMIIDLAKDVFEQLAPLSQGVVQVTITW